MYQVSTLQALMLGYSRSVITVGELIKHGNTGLGTFEDVDGEMIVTDGVCYRATETGEVVKAGGDKGVPFCAVCNMEDGEQVELGAFDNISDLKDKLNLIIDGHFGLNSMHMVKSEGDFGLIDARSESPYRSHHVTLKNILGKTQKTFKFENIKGTLVAVYFPDYMDGINASGWHLHFVSSDRTKGGHVFEIKMRGGKALINKINSIELKLPDEPVFDTYMLKKASGNDIKTVEQGKG